MFDRPGALEHQVDAVLRGFDVFVVHGFDRFEVLLQDTFTASSSLFLIASDSSLEADALGCVHKNASIKKVTHLWNRENQNSFDQYDRAWVNMLNFLFRL